MLEGNMDSFDTPEHKKNWLGRDTISLCMKNMINLTRTIFEHKDVKQIKKDLGFFAFQKEFATLKIQFPRQTGHTTACIKMLEENPHSAMLFKNYKMKQHIVIQNPEVRGRLFTVDEFIDPDKHYNVSLVLVDNASYIEESKIEKVLLKSADSGDFKCICMLVQ